jgi:integrase
MWRRAADLANVRIHDLRHGFASMGLMTGDALLIIGKLLGHADKGLIPALFVDAQDQALSRGSLRRSATE